MKPNANPYPTRLGLQIITKRDPSGYFHCQAYPVTIGLNTWEQRYTADHPDDDSYKDISLDRVRNTGSERYNGLRLDSFQVNSQGNNDDDPRHLYSWECRYFDVYDIDTTRAVQMAKTLTTIDRRMAKSETQYGRPATFGQYVGRVAQAIGADTIITVNGRESGWHHENQYRFQTIGDGISRIDGLVRAWIDERMIGAQATA